MAVVASLLELPTTSNGLEFLGSSIIEHGSASPRRKIARLGTDSDIGSRSTTKTKQTGPFVVHIVGEDIALKSQSDIDAKRTQSLNAVKRAIRTILDIGASQDGFKKTYESIFAACRTLVTVYDDGAGLYDHVKLGLETGIKTLASHLQNYDEKDQIKWLGYFAGHCTWFESKVALLQSLLTYLDRVYVVNYPKTTKPVRNLAYEFFAERIFGNQTIARRLRTGVSNWLEYERDHETETEEREKIAELIKNLIAHKQYTAFEEHYLEITQLYYQKESKANAESMKDDPKGFFNRIETRIKQEMERSRDLLPVGSWNPVLETTERALLGGRIEFLAISLIPLLLEVKDMDSLKDLYVRFARVKELKALSGAFQNYIQSEVIKIVTDTARDDEMVERLLALQRLGDTVTSQAFVTEAPHLEQRQKATTSTTASDTKSDRNFVNALWDAFNKGFRARRNKPAEMIARYLDKQLRKGQKGVADAVFQGDLKQVLPLYRHTEDKDVFRAFYHRALAKRLLVGKSASTDIEKWLLKELKDHYDPEFGTAEEMFQDLNISKDMMEEYHRKKSKINPDSTKLSVMVLKQSAWPYARPQTVVDLPADMQVQLTRFADYYKKEHSGRALHWDHALGTVTLRATFNPGVKELSVSLYQAIVLLLFNDQDELPFKDIADQTRMVDADLRRTLQSLACGKTKVLKKHPHGREVEDGDVFNFNHDFTDPLYRVHINSIQVKVSAEESEKTNVSVEHDRGFSLEAAIVRIMKAKKEMNYEQLKIAAIDAVKNHFVPSVEFIKKTIDGLVDKEYLERSAEDKNKFFYLA